jgi:hypothetical protein
VSGCSGREGCGSGRHGVRSLEVCACVQRCVCSGALCCLSAACCVSLLPPLHLIPCPSLPCPSLLHSTIMAEHFGSLALPVGEFLALEHGTGGWVEVGLGGLSSSVRVTSAPSTVYCAT